MNDVGQHRIVRTALALAALCIGATGTVQAEDNRFQLNNQLAAVVPSSPSRSLEESRHVLSASDTKNYQLVFDLQDQGDMRGANQIMLRIQDKILLGHVLAERYLHPTAYTSNFFELSTWLQSFADHPQADRIYRLALRKKPAGAPNPRQPVFKQRFSLAAAGGEDETPYQQALERLSRNHRKSATSLYRKVLDKISDGHTMTAKVMLLDKNTAKNLPRFLLDKLRARLAMAYFGDGRYQYALEWAEKALSGSGDKFAMPYWTAGLAAWRLGDMKTALAHFKKVADHKRATGGLRAAGAYWVARIHSRERNAAMVNRYLATAAKYPESFYGLMARHHLGMGTGFDWNKPGRNHAEAAELHETPSGKRALALLQASQRKLAEQEIWTLAINSSDHHRRRILAAAAHLGMPDLGMKFSSAHNQSGGRSIDFAAYPIPPWEPISGFHIDRALILAIARQESKFKVNARSHAGARGVLQLMPATAKSMARKLGISLDPGTLTNDLEANLELGQAYLRYLLQKPEIDGNLLLLLAAWNAGPTNPIAWKQAKLYGDDPLLFIESIPWQETRLFVKNVMANYWIYRHQLRQKPQSLHTLADGKWPTYQSLD